MKDMTPARRKRYPFFKCLLAWSLALSSAGVVRATPADIESSSKILRVDCLGGRGHKLRATPLNEPNPWLGSFLALGSPADAALEIRLWRDGGRGVDDIEGELTAIEWNVPEKPLESYPLTPRRVLFGSLDMRERVRVEDWKLDSALTKLLVSKASDAFFVHGTLFVIHPTVNGGRPMPRGLFCALPAP